jgi:hypothetical protein
MLQAVKTFTDIASGGFVGLSAVPLMRAKLYNICATSDIDCSEVTDLKLKILANIDKRFPMNNFIVVAILIDPASKNKKYLNLTLEEKSEVLITALRKAENDGVVNRSSRQRDQTSHVTGSGSDVTAAAAVDRADAAPLPKRLRHVDEFEEEDATGDIAASLQ